MRKPIVVLILLIVSGNLIIGQERGNTRISLVLEPVISWMKSDYVLPDKRYGATSKGVLPGYNFGIKIDHFFGENYAFATGLTVNTAGGKIFYPLIDGVIPGINHTYRLKHIEIPLGLRLRSDDFHRINIYGRFGLSPQFNIKASDRDGNTIRDEIKFFDLSYHLGGGVEYSLGGRNALMIGLIFNNGFVDITKNRDFEDKAIMNRFTLEFGFIF